MAPSRRRALAAGLLAALFAPQLAAQRGGQADIAAQGYYLTGQGTLIDTSGLALRFQELIPDLGLLSGSVESYGSQGRLRQGDDYLQLRGLRWLGYRWNLTGGDFRVPTILTGNPFTNLFYPELNLRGFEVEVSRENLKASAFIGEQTLFEGPRIPFRRTTGEHVLGGTVNYRFGSSLEVGLRLMNITENPNQLDNFLFPVNRRFSMVNVGALQATYHPFKRFRVFAETSASRGDLAASPVRSNSNPLSLFAGAAYESDLLTVRANYADQGALYLPIAGYFAGDRRGPFGEVHLRPIKRVDLFGSASEYTNNRENDTNVPTFHSMSVSAGISLQLPSKFTLSGQFSTLRFNSTDAASMTRSDNQEWTATLNRPLGRQNLRFTYREMKLVNNQLPTRQISREAEDLVQFHNFLVGGSMRLDSTASDQHRNTVFVRGIAQVRLHRLTAYSYVDLGRDLVNQSVFATNSVNSTIFGLTAGLPNNWNLQAEGFRNTLAMALNPSNVFILQGQGVYGPSTFAGIDQWSLYFRVSKHLRWGEALPSEGLDRFTTEHVPITAVVEGTVYEVTAQGRQPVAGIPVGVDNSRFAVTSASGNYRLDSVPEGLHDVALRISELPAEFEPGAVQDRNMVISTRRTNKLDFEVYRLGDICGRVLSPPDLVLDTVVVRLKSTPHYTTPADDGSFCFHNLRSGSYEVELDTTTLPEQTLVAGPTQIPFVLDARTSDGNAPKPEFRIERHVEVKPVRRKVLNSQESASEPPHPSGPASPPPARTVASPKPIAAPTVSRPAATIAPRTSKPVPKATPHRKTRRTIQHKSKPRSIAVSTSRRTPPADK